jgi:uncharacterized small protein (TIGR04563 family)
VTFPAKRKLSIYIPDSVLRQMQEEAKRLDRPLSWIIQRAWRVGYARMKSEREARERGG